MRQGWKFEFQGNELETFSCAATKGDTEIIRDNFNCWSLICDIVSACDEAENKGLFG